jgi:Tol biopolymer transport system component
VGTTTLNGVFIPGTHNRLFNTYLYPPKKTEGGNGIIGLFVANTDTGEIKELLKPRLVGDMFSLANGNFSVSPDGKMVSVAMSGHIDIFSMEGKVIYPNIATYTLSTPMELFPMQYWLPDSSGLILALPAERIYDPTNTTPTYSVWRYGLDSNVAVQVPLDPPPTEPGGCGIRVSPDGNWIIYDTDAADLYIGNLSNGYTQLYAQNACPHYSWSPDNRHFIYAHGVKDELFLGTVDEPLVSIGEVGFLGWFDASHYIYYILPASHQGKKNILVGEIDGKKIATYESEISLPENFGELTFIILDHKADK